MVARSRIPRDAVIPRCRFASSTVGHQRSLHELGHKGAIDCGRKRCVEGGGASSVWVLHTWGVAAPVHLRARRPVGVIFILIRSSPLLTGSARQGFPRETAHSLQHASQQRSLKTCRIIRSSTRVLEYCARDPTARITQQCATAAVRNPKGVCLTASWPHASLPTLEHRVLHVNERCMSSLTRAPRRDARVTGPTHRTTRSAFRGRLLDILTGHTS